MKDHIKMKELNIGGLRIKVPIVQGGMGVGISLSGLASAVANEGGVGVISPVGLGFLYKDYSSDYFKNCLHGLKSEIRKTREKTSGIIGVNVMVALSDYTDLVKTSIQEGVDIIFSGAGLPLDLPKYLTEGAKTKLVPIVSSARAAELICKKWKANFNYLPDAIVVEGPKAGGHLGFKANQLENENFSLDKIIPEVVEVAQNIGTEHHKEIPVIAAGGIYSGEDIANIMDKGASGVQMGTRFVTTHECDASEGFKNAYINASKDDIKVIQSPVGMPGRAIKSSFINDFESGNRKPVKCPVNCLKTCNIEKTPYCIIASLVSAMKGNFKNGYAFAGSNVWKNDKIVSVKELFTSIYDEFSGAIKQKLS